MRAHERRRSREKGDQLNQLHKDLEFDTGPGGATLYQDAATRAKETLLRFKSNLWKLENIYRKEHGQEKLK